MVLFFFFHFAGDDNQQIKDEYYAVIDSVDPLNSEQSLVVFHSVVQEQFDSLNVKTSWVTENQLASQVIVMNLQTKKLQRRKKFIIEGKWVKIKTG